MYSAEIVDGVVTRVIVGDPAWAADNLGGVWVAADDPYPGPGWTWDGVMFTPPAVEDDPELEDPDVL